MKTAIYPITGDGIHNGHIAIAKEAADVFDKLIIALGNDTNKKRLFSLIERVEIARQAFRNSLNIEVVAYDGLMVDYMSRVGIFTYIRGFRDTADFEAEMRLFKINRELNSKVKLILLPAPEYENISSSMIKEVITHGGDVHKYVPLCVKRKLEENINTQYIVGITGEIAVGKSWLGKRLTTICNGQYLKEAHYIDMDEIAHYVLSGKSRENICVETRKRIFNSFSNSTSLVLKNKDTYEIDRENLSKILFCGNNSWILIPKFNEIMAPAVLYILRQQMKDKEGIIFVDSALMAECGLSYICNNNIILTYCCSDTQKKRLLQRGLSEDLIDKRLLTQLTTVQKQATLNRRIKIDNVGNLWEINTLVDDLHVFLVAKLFPKLGLDN